MRDDRQAIADAAKVRRQCSLRRAFAVSKIGILLRQLLQYLVLAGCLGSALAEQRFPPPDFEGGHQLPISATPPARAVPLQYVDLFVLVACLTIATWSVHKHRSRRAIVGLSIFSVLYFGFWRKGCVCSIGSVQNVSLAIFGSNYGLPIAAMAFFVLPLVIALFFGRTFCAAVCPHGALQDLVLLKPVKVPLWLEQGLGVLPYAFLGAAVLFAATGSTFLICQYDPFVAIFRMNGRILMVLIGIALLLLGVFVGRPYCRFLCPYGALLRIASALSRWPIRVTPDFCTQCRLCESSCPFGALRQPEGNEQPLGNLSADRRRLGSLLLLVPLLIAGGGFVGWYFSGTASLLHPTVNLARQFVQERARTIPYTDANSAAQLAIERARQTPDELLSEAAAIRKRFEPATTIFGGWLGLVVGLKLVSLSLRRKRTDYEPDSGACMACARCFESCPNELMRRGIPAALSLAVASSNRTEERTVPSSN
jgi:ferredoxin